MDHPRKSSKTNVTVARILAMVVLALVSLATVDAMNPRLSLNSLKFQAINCRKHSALLTEFGGVGDGVTSNTLAFRKAIEHLSTLAKDGGAQLVVPPGKWLTGSFNLTSHFTLFIDKEAKIIASQNESEWPLVEILPSYGRGRDAPNGRYSSLIFGTNLTDVVITGNNGTIDGQGSTWWEKFKKGELKVTRPYVIEIMYSEQIQISDLTLINSPSWFVHPIYSRNVIIQGLTILAPVTVPNTDGINPDSCSNTLIEDCYIVSGDDCIAVKSGWDQYGIKFGMPTEDLVIRRLTCISPDSAAIALGSEMSGGIRNVRIENVTAINTQAAVRIKTARGRGGFVKDIFVRKMFLSTMKYVFWMTGNYKAHADDKFDPSALPVIKNINYRDMVAENVNMSANLVGISGDPFTDICISNVKIGLSKKPKKLQWNCTDVEGFSSDVDPPPCAPLAKAAKSGGCDFPEDKLPIENVQLKSCSVEISAF
ncbi:probable polygalacturonase [Cucurbita pepo subsp. pepo]|uniref:probable polygalacturonase n=1 Tax=Cucurbita pepo subsp. pepo TaxID=3664 RepID=UPI000C9D4F28|nr:probable polygalacturonase [Cucurbita pepo subsp. pepo]